MLAEVEDGELSSENECDNQKKSATASATTRKHRVGSGELTVMLNTEEQSVLQKIIESGAESGEISDENVDLNPYEAEDVSLLKQKSFGL